MRSWRTSSAGNGHGQPALSLDDERQMARSLMHATVSRHMETRLAHGGVLPDGDYDARLVKAIDDAMYEAGALQELLDDDLIENIDINGCDEVWITYADHRGKVRGAPVTATDEDLIVLLQTLASYAGVNARPFTPAHPVLDIRLPDGSRLSAVMSATERPAASIRRNRFPQMTMPELVRLGTATPDVGGFLKAAVLARKNILIAGSTDAGKTTTARACINCIPATERLLVIERSLELVAAPPPGAAPGCPGDGGGTARPGRQRRVESAATGVPEPPDEPQPRHPRRGHGTRSPWNSWAHSARATRVAFRPSMPGPRWTRSTGSRPTRRCMTRWTSRSATR